jgi:hypothetical protein
MLAMNIKIIFLSIVLVALSFPTVLAQSVKNEIEDSIQKQEMPKNAIETLDEFWPDLNDIRYYFQTDGDRESYEAKLEWRGRNYSIEFDEAGKILNVEQLIDWKNISSEVSKPIDEYLQKGFRRVNIIRLQRQYIASDDDDSDNEDFIDDILEGDEEDFEIRYEFEVEGRSGQEIGAFELLFDHAGVLIERRKIERRSIDNIW